MTKIKVEVEFEINDQSWCAYSTDKEEMEWFWNEVIPSCMILLHSNDVGDTVSETTKFKIIEVTNDTTHPSNK